MKWRKSNVIIAVCVLIAVAPGLLLIRNGLMGKGTEALKENNGALALRYLKPLAMVGDKTAQILIGYIYAYGWGDVPKNDGEAIYWFRRAGPLAGLGDGDKADPAAPYELAIGKAFADGSEGVKIDHAESFKWLKRAAKDGSKEAAVLLEDGPPRVD